MIDKENEEKLHTRQIGNELAGTVIKGFKYSWIGTVVITIIVFIVFGFIIYFGFHEYSKTNVELYNSELKIYNGTQLGQGVSSLLDEVTNKLSKNKEHKISISYDNQVFSTIDEIINLKNNIGFWNRYNVIF